MKTNELRRKPASIPNRRWATYASAAAATALAGSQSAEAAMKGSATKGLVRTGEYET